MRHLRIDLETRSGADITKTGNYRYTLDPEFAILLFGYKMDDDPTVVIDLASGESIPPEIIDALQDPDVIKHAYNAAFEFFCLDRVGLYSPLDQWQCSQAHGLYCGYPAGLEAIGKAVGLAPDKQKMSVGKSLIRFFCLPQAPTKSNGGRRWNLPQHDPDKWELFKAYNKQDVETEYEIDKLLDSFPMPESEWEMWRFDVSMNIDGVGVDMDLVNGALAIDAACREELTREAVNLTGVDNPNSTSQLLAWLQQEGVETDNLTKTTVGDILQTDQPDHVKRLLEIRQQLGKSSVKKYAAMSTAVCEDLRIRGISQYYGASRTGRWAGRLVQMQNLPRNYIHTLDEARHLVKKCDYKTLQMVYGDVQDTLSQLIRTAFIPFPGRKFVVADFSAIEARVIAWLAGEQWANEVFASHGKIYEATASQMFRVPIEQIKKGNPEYALRQKGKVATLALGYQGGVNSLITMGALSQGLTEEELPDIVNRWRNANKNICALWYNVENAAVDTLATGAPHTVRGLIFRLEGNIFTGQVSLSVQLPSGRKIFYPRPFLQENRFGKMAVHYYSMDDKKKWGVNSTYGGKLTENIVQAIARDCLAITLRRVQDHGYDTVFHVHDEVIIDAPQELTVDEVCNWMAEPIPWAPGLILKGAGFESEYYMKD